MRSAALHRANGACAGGVNIHTGPQARAVHGGSQQPRHAAAADAAVRTRRQRRTVAAGWGAPLCPRMQSLASPSTALRFPSFLATEQNRRPQKVCLSDHHPAGPRGQEVTEKLSRLRRVCLRGPGTSGARQKSRWRRSSIMAVGGASARGRPTAAQATARPTSRKTASTAVPVTACHTSQRGP